MGALVVLSLMAAWMVGKIVLTGQPGEQRLAYGLTGALLGALWSHFGRLIDRCAHLSADPPRAAVAKRIDQAMRVGAGSAKKRRRR